MEIQAVPQETVRRDSYASKMATAEVGGILQPLQSTEDIRIIITSKFYVTANHCDDICIDLCIT